MACKQLIPCILALMTFRHVMSQGPRMANNRGDKRHAYTAEFNVEPADVTHTCDGEGCSGVNFEKIDSLFPGLFFSGDSLKTSHKKVQKERLERIEPNFPKETQTRPSKKEDDIDIDRTEEQPTSGENEGKPELDVDHDWDQCCATRQTFMLNDTLLNINNERRTIVHLKHLKPEPKYQLIPIGECVPGHGRCTRCVMEKVLHYLLVIDESGSKQPPFEFDLFQLDMYCSCKGGM